MYSSMKNNDIAVMFASSLYVKLAVQSYTGYQHSTPFILDSGFVVCVSHYTCNVAVVLRCMNSIISTSLLYHKICSCIGFMASRQRLFGLLCRLFGVNRHISFIKLFISNQNYIRFYKLICCDSV
jgi:hypothetical protein